MTKVPPTGGDTLWASGYELYDRLSPPYQKFFESLTATHDVPGLRAMCEKQPDQSQVYTGERGAPENQGLKLKCESHPMVRTHPVTRWKTLFAGGIHCRRINGVTESESQEILAKLLRLIADNHDLQVRFRWQSEGDIAVWDNRCGKLFIQIMLFFRGHRKSAVCFYFWVSDRRCRIRLERGEL